jgi:hypothetical protein
MLLLWIVLLVSNLYFAFVLAGTWQAVVSLMFVALSTYYIIKHTQAKTS